MNDTTAATAGWELSRTFETDGVVLAWDRWGPDDGVPLLLVHGFSGSSFDFATHVAALAADRPVVTLDHRGHGRSTKLGRTDGYSLDRLAADLAAFVAAHVEAPFDLLGHSMGGVLAQKLVLDHGADVRRLVLMDTSATDFVPDDPEAASMVAGFLERFDPTRGLPPALPPSPEDQLIAVATSEAWRTRKEEQSAAFDPFAMKALGTALLAGGESLGVADRLDRITSPTLVLVGALDGALVGRAAHLAEALPDATHVSIEGAYHSPQLTHPDEWRRAIVDHLDG